jgi:hypothetical protein
LDCTLKISHELKIDAREFAAAWNQNPESKGIAQAQVADNFAKDVLLFLLKPYIVILSSATKSAGLTHAISHDMIYQGLVFLAGVAGTVALDTLKDAITDHIKKILAAKAESNNAPTVEIIVIQTEGKLVIVVNAKQT